MSTKRRRRNVRPDAVEAIPTVCARGRVSGPRRISTVAPEAGIAAEKEPSTSAPAAAEVLHVPVPAGDLDRPSRRVGERDAGRERRSAGVVDDSRLQARAAAPGESRECEGPKGPAREGFGSSSCRPRPSDTHSTRRRRLSPPAPRSSRSCTCVAPGASVTASSSAFAVSTQTIPVHSSSPKSGIAFAFAIHGFQTTVVAEPGLARRRCAAASRDRRS